MLSVFAREVGAVWGNGAPVDRPPFVGNGTAGRIEMLLFGKSSKTAVGLDIGSHSVKVVEISRSGKTLKLSRYATQELNPGTVVDGEVVNRDHLVATIQDVLRTAGIKPKTVYTAISGRSVIVRRIQMEKMSEEEARQAIRWEAEQHIPFRIDEVSLDFKIIDEDMAPGQMEVLLVAAKREVVDLHRGLLRGAGLKPESIELEQFALQRVYEQAYQPGPDDCVTILNIGAEVTNMVVVKGGLPSFNRDLSIGGNRFIEAIQRSLGLDYEKAEAVLKGESPEDVSEEEVRSAIGYVIDELSTSVRRSFISFQAAGESTRIDRMYISGGCSLVPGLASILSEQHGLPVEPLHPFRGLQVDPSVIPDADRAAAGAVLAVCTGLALRQFAPGTVDVDIMGELVERKKKKKKKETAGESVAANVLSYVPLVLIVVGVVLMALHYSGLKDDEEILREEITEVEASIREMETQREQQQEMQQLRAELEEKTQSIRQLALQQNFTVYVMEYMARALYPEQSALAEETEKSIYLTGMVLSQNSLQISGVARTWGDIVSFQRRLTEQKPDGTNLLFTMEEYGQTYNLSTQRVGDRTGGEPLYQFEMQVGVNPASLEPLLGDYAEI
jgi:type IV pilus assembly protein PilM